MLPSFSPLYRYYRRVLASQARFSAMMLRSLRSGTRFLSLSLAQSHTHPSGSSSIVARSSCYLPGRPLSRPARPFTALLLRGVRASSFCSTWCFCHTNVVLSADTLIFDPPATHSHPLCPRLQLPFLHKPQLLRALGPVRPGAITRHHQATSKFL